MLHLIASFIRACITPATRSPAFRRAQLMLESLEHRDAMSVSPAGPALDDYAYPVSAAAQSGVTGVYTGGTIATMPTMVLDGYYPTKYDRDVAMGLPMLDSNPGATATLYLNFTGNFVRDWWWNNSDGTQTHFANVTTPAFDMDGDATKFSTAEQASIREIFNRVAEDYSPFNINVSTHYYGALGDRQALEVAIGGRPGDWLGGGASGISSIGSFTDSAPNIVFAFAGDIVWWANNGGQDWEGRPLDIETATATTISHEAGHGFGLRHHAEYDANGVKTNDYAKGTSEWTPIMGNNLSSDRAIWTYAADDRGVNSMEDDVSILAGTNNGFGFRRDDHGATTLTATAMTPVYSPSILAPIYTSTGIIESGLDRDMFKFTLSATTSVQLRMDPAHDGPNLRARFELMTSSGYLASAPPAWTASQQIINITLNPGTYYLRVSTYGSSELGQYSVGVYTGWSAGTLSTYSARTTTISTMSVAAYSGIGFMHAGIELGKQPLLPAAEILPAVQKAIDRVLKYDQTPDLAPVAMALASRRSVKSRASDEELEFALEEWARPWDA
jgi:hypothetical protein